MMFIPSSQWLTAKLKCPALLEKKYQKLKEVVKSTLTWVWIERFGATIDYLSVEFIFQVL